MTDSKNGWHVLHEIGRQRILSSARILRLEMFSQSTSSERYPFLTPEICNARINELPFQILIFRIWYRSWPLPISGMPDCSASEDGH